MITIKELEKLASLARIKLEDKEKEPFLKEFESILNYVDQLKKVDISLDTEGRIGAVKNVMREDMVRTTTDEDRERLLKEAPFREGDFVVVKKIIG